METKPVRGAEFMETIMSAANSRIKRLCALRQKSRERRKEGVFLIEGQRLCQDTPDKFLQEFYITQELLAEVSGKAADIADGFVLQYSGIDENCTFDALFAEKQELLRDKIREILW